MYWNTCNNYSARDEVIIMQLMNFSPKTTAFRLNIKTKFLPYENVPLYSIQQRLAILKCLRLNKTKFLPYENIPLYSIQQRLAILKCLRLKCTSYHVSLYLCSLDGSLNLTVCSATVTSLVNIAHVFGAGSAHEVTLFPMAL